MKTKNLFFLMYFVILISLVSCVSKQYKEAEREAIEAPWLSLSPSLWENLIPDSKTDSQIPLPSTDLKLENIGTTVKVEGLFDRWSFNDDIKDRIFANYAEITNECKGQIELDFAFSKEEWAKTENQIKYYESVNNLIDKISEKFIADMENVLTGDEKDYFVRAFKSVVWNESLWQHYYRHKDWFFVLLSAKSFNKLCDWGITQIARSSHITGQLLSKPFFDTKAYCKISSSLYYGMAIYYFYYLKAREHPLNGNKVVMKLLGAYNSYSSGYEGYFWNISNSREDMRDFQLGALGGFLTTYINKPWETKVADLKNNSMNK